MFWLHFSRQTGKSILQCKANCKPEWDRYLLFFNFHTEPHETACSGIHVEYLLGYTKQNSNLTVIKHGKYTPQLGTEFYLKYLFQTYFTPLVVIICNSSVIASLFWNLHSTSEQGIMISVDVKGTIKM